MDFKWTLWYHSFIKQVLNMLRLIHAFGRLSFTAKYITALMLIAMLSTLAFFNLNHLISSQSNDGKLITISGQQIMLSQKIALYAIYYQTKQLEQSIKEMEDNHSFLVNSEMSEKLNNVYFKDPVNLDNKVKTFLSNAKRFQLTRDGKSLTYVLKNSQILLEEFGEAGKAYLEEADDRTLNLKRVESFIYIMTLLTLLLEALFIFMPANISINRKARELTREKNYSNAVIESSTNAIISLDYDGKVRTYNKMAERIFGYQRDEMKKASDLLKLIPTRYYKVHDIGVEAFLSRHLPITSGEVYELEARNKNGSYFPIRISFGTSGEESLAIVANIQDITIERLNDTLMHKQAKFAALGEMIAIIAHQWRQPLAELSFNNMYLKKKIDAKDLEKELIENEGIIQFMSDTISSFESFYAKTPKEWFFPKDAILQGVKIVKSLFKLSGIELELNLNSAPALYGQQNGLAQVILSLLQNSIRIHKSNESLNPWIKIDLKSNDEEVIISVLDNGGGVKQKPLESIFKPFLSDKKSPSTGLGLYMSRLVIEEKFHGTVNVENIEDGACFTITIPIKLSDNQAY